MPPRTPDETIGDELSALLDRLARLTGNPDADAAFAELTAAYAGDSRLHIPATVFNAVLNRPEPAPPGGVNSVLSDFRQ